MVLDSSNNSINLSESELLQLLKELESDRVEKKENFKGDVATRAREAVCAFANDFPNHQKPGVLFIGAKDDGSPSGLEITETLLNSLADMKTDGNILPPPSLTVQKYTFDGKEMAVVVVMPSNSPPVKYKGRIWIRTGARREIANANDEQILNEKRQSKQISFDNYPVASAKVSDLSKSIFENDYLPSAFARDILEGNHRSYEERLASCKMVDSVKGATPTVLGILTIGNRVTDFIPGAYVQFLRIEGTELTDPISDEQSIDGTLMEVLRRTQEKLDSHNRRQVDNTSSPRHIIDCPYPMAALQQLFYNAVLHRRYKETNAPIRIYWFNDRIEISSPGGPYGNVTKENFGEYGITDYRNPNIAEVLKNLGYVQKFGSGIAIARKELEKNGNPQPEFSVNENIVQWIVYSKP